MEQIPGGDLTGWAAVLASVGAGFLWLRRYLTGDTVERLANKAAAEIIETLREQLVAERERADLERERAERMIAAMEAQDTQMRALRDEVHMLSTEVLRLRAQIAVSTPNATP
jgi:molybdopterin converting factor small subunit